MYTRDETTSRGEASMPRRARQNTSSGPFCIDYSLLAPAPRNGCAIGVGGARNPEGLVFAPGQSFLHAANHDCKIFEIIIDTYINVIGVM